MIVGIAYRFPVSHEDGSGLIWPTWGTAMTLPDEFEEQVVDGLVALRNTRTGAQGGYRLETSGWVVAARLSTGTFFSTATDEAEARRILIDELARDVAPSPVNSVFHALARALGLEAA